jgi:hypothetical protein
MALAAVALLAALPADAPRFPVEGIYALSATFGELRPDHFHGGLDIKTGGRTGMPVYAVQEGYVYRIKVSPFGYGKALYLRHPSGHFSLYAHLESFTPEIERYVEARQFASQQTSQELYLSPAELPVAAGAWIANSGNSGSSLGPHLHYEWRDPEDRPLDPLVWYRDLLPDHRPPVVEGLALEPLAPHARIAGQAHKRLIPLRGAPGAYTWADTIEITGPAGLEYEGFDQLDGASNPCGINFASLYLDGIRIYAWELRQFGFEENRFINQHFDYAWYQRTGRRFEKAYADSELPFPAEVRSAGDGILHFEDRRPHLLRLELRDLAGNTTSVSGWVRQGTAALPALRIPKGARPLLSYEIRRNAAVVHADYPLPAWREQGLICLYQSGQRRRILPAGGTPQRLSFAIPVDRFDYPAAVQDSSGRYRIDFAFGGHVFPDRSAVYQAGEVQLYFPPQSVFGPVPLEWRPNGEGIEVGAPYIPVYQGFVISFPPPADPEAGPFVVARRDGGRWRYTGSSRNREGRIYASANHFGTYALVPDPDPPQISPGNFTPGRTVAPAARTLIIRIEDGFSGIDDLHTSVWLGGRWLPADYDFKSRQLSIDLTRYRPAPGRCLLEVTAADQAGNTARQSYELLF